MGGGILQALPRVEIRDKKEEYYEEKWWDAECHNRKEDLKKALDGLRRGEVEGKE